MTEAVDIRKLESELEAIRKDIEFIKKHMIDIDSILSDDDRAALKKVEEEHKNGETVSHDEIRKELGL